MSERTNQTKSMAELVPAQSKPTLTGAIDRISQKILTAKQEPKEEMTIAALKKTFVWVCAASGIKDLPSNEIAALCQTMWNDKYGPQLSNKELDLAFNLNLSGDLNEKVIHYQCFSVEFFCQVLNAYIEKKTEVNRKLKVAEQLQALPTHTPDVSSDVLADILLDFKAMHAPEQYQAKAAFPVQFKLNYLAQIVTIDINEDLIAEYRIKASLTVVADLIKQKNGIYNVEAKFGKVVGLTHQIARIKAGKLIEHEDERLIQAEVNNLIYTDTLKAWAPKTGETIDNCPFAVGIKENINA